MECPVGEEAESNSRYVMARREWWLWEILTTPRRRGSSSSRTSLVPSAQSCNRSPIKGGSCLQGTVLARRPAWPCGTLGRVRVRLRRRPPGIDCARFHAFPYVPQNQWVRRDRWTLRWHPFLPIFGRIVGLDMGTIRRGKRRFDCLGVRQQTGKAHCSLRLADQHCRWTLPSSPAVPFAGERTVPAVSGRGVRGRSSGS